MSRFVEGKTKICVVGGCDKDAVHYDGILVKSRDAVSAGFCEHHWFITQCPNTFGIKNCYGVFDKSLGLLPLNHKIQPTNQ